MARFTLRLITLEMSESSSRVEEEGADFFLFFLDLDLALAGVFVEPPFLPISE